MRSEYWSYGWSVLILAGMISLYVWRGGQSLLFVIALLILLILQGGLIRFLGPQRIKITRVYNPVMPRAGMPISVQLTITLEGGLPPLWIVVEDLGIAGVNSTKLLFIGFRRQYIGTYQIDEPARGIYRGISTSISLGDPFGWFTRTVRVVSADSVIVHPKPLPVEACIVGASVRDHTALGGLRNYELGDPLKYIHWKSSARRGYLLTRRPDEIGQMKCCLLLDTHAMSYGQDVLSFETAVAAAASYIENVCDSSYRASYRGRLQQELMLYHSTATKPTNLQGSEKEVKQGFDLLADMKLISEKKAKSESLFPLTPDKLLLHASRSINHASDRVLMTMITGDITGKIVDAAVLILEKGIELEIWYTGAKQANVSSNTQSDRLRSYGVRVVVIEAHSRAMKDSRKEGAVDVIA